MKYSVKASEGEKARMLSERYGLDMLTSTILERRGLVSEEDMKFFLEKDIIYQHSPFLFEDSQIVVERIQAAIEEDERILVFGDRDVDGITATAIMVKELGRAGAKNLEYRLPMDDEPYGLTMDTVAEILGKNVDLLITVDNGISAVDEIRALRDAGVDTIVLDHHLAGDELPPALAIMNPKVEGSGYPFNGLAGCMVAFKACYALRMSRSDIYSSEFILLHASLGNGSVRINAVRFENLVEVDRLTEEVAEGCYSLENSRMIRFLSIGRPILVMDKDTELKLLRRAFGSSVDINLVEIRPALEKVISSVRGRSLFELSNISRAARYEKGDPEIETLVSLYRSASIYQKKELYSNGIDELIELATLGSVADLMPLRDENRLFVKRGLLLLERNPMFSLRYLLSKLELLGRPIGVRDISFYISPVINASGRMGKPDIALRLLLSENQDEIVSLTDRLLELNRERQRSTEEALERCRPVADASLEYYGGKLILVEGDVPRGLTGAIASRFLNEYDVPSLVLAGMDDGRISASMRTRKGFDARLFLDNFSHLFQDFGGHSCAAGFSMDAANLDRFRSELSSVISQMKTSGPAETELEVDAELRQDMVDEYLWKVKEMCEPFGQENERLLFHLSRVHIADVSPNRNGGTYLRFTLDINSQFWPSVWWEHDKEPGYFGKGDEVDIVFSPETNTWKGMTRLQLNVVAMEKSS